MGCGVSKTGTHDDSVTESEKESVALRLNFEAKEMEEAAKFDDARALYERALELMRVSKGESSVGYAVILSNMACLLRTETRYDEALQLFGEALVVIENSSDLTEDARYEMLETMRANALQTEAWQNEEELEILEFRATGHS
jgi:tetratricopeptide (TPR) repeat protein|eukprot:30876-Pelagococcus_subviridis.AAC.1